MERRNTEKAELLYAALDRMSGFYRAPVEKAARSTMNIVFRLPSEELDDRFVAEAKKQPAWWASRATGARAASG